MVVVYEEQVMNDACVPATSWERPFNLLLLLFALSTLSRYKLQSYHCLGSYSVIILATCVFLCLSHSRRVLCSEVSQAQQ